MKSIGLKAKKTAGLEDIKPDLLAKNLQFVKLQIRDLQKREKELKLQLDTYIDGNVKEDEKGNRFFKFNFNDVPMLVVRQARKSVSVSIDKCKEVFASDILCKIIKETITENVDESAMEELISEECISMDELASVTDTKITYATVIVEEKEEEVDDGL